MRFVLAVSFAAASFAALAEVSLPAVFGDHMVLQRGKPLPIWGRAEPGEKVTVAFNGATASGDADAKGFWTATLPPQEACTEGKALEVKADSGSRTFKDVLVGDVWLVSGQSNAELNLGSCIGYKEAVAETNRLIRHIKFHRVRAIVPSRYEVKASPWVIPSAKLYQTTTMTGMGFFFARDIVRKTGVPVGILDNNWGGCHIETYCSAEGFETAARLHPDDPFFRNALDSRLAGLRRLAKNFEGKSGADSLSAFELDELQYQDAFYLFSQYNAMIRPIVRFPIAGALWYQGCANNPGEPVPRYTRFLEALVYGWREAWGYDFPVYIVQIAALGERPKTPQGGDGYAWVRDAQLKGHRAIPNTGLAVAIDIGNAKDIHPRNKQDVGERCALWALRDVYGRKDLVVSGPLYREAKIEGDAIRVSFDHVGSGLVVAEKDPDGSGVPAKIIDGGELRGFSIAGADHKWHFAAAKIDGETVVVSAPEVKAPVAVRYAFRGNPMGDCNLYNREGLPASPFRTDDWEKRK